jgi:hypothetical protein
VLAEEALAEPPVEPEALRQVGGDYQSRAIGQPAFVRELTHRGVDDGDARLALAPAGERLVVLAPLALARAEIAAGQVGVGREQLLEEVAPAESSHEGCASLVLSGSCDEFHGRDAAEMEVRAQTRRRVAGEAVGVVFIASEAAREPLRQAASAGCFPAAREVRCGGGPTQLLDGWNGPLDPLP